MERKPIKKLTAWERVEIARKQDRPNALYYINNICDSFIEFHGDRAFADDKSVVGGIGEIEGINITIIGIVKGNNAKENIERNFGMPNPEGYKKALRLMKQAEKFKRPIICLIDTPGAYPGIGAEERGQGYAIAQNLQEMFDIKVPIISVIIGEGGSGGALALGVGDRVFMLENAIYSILTPEGFASILWKDASRSKEAAEVMGITAQELLDSGIIDKVIREPIGGAHINPEKMAWRLKRKILPELEALREMNTEELLEARYNKFRAMGNFY
ncbi:acetyl-CoA carboxylase carboxyltransferase subunit alpha [Clostridium sp. 'White wine YQ']|uniref:acetyl-CoA carboxylase carboxyltransferase subunit alpha n=1 Tax=Clostridium sp. 'White wine YQ' TaxID=3027474 RepID=UPI00236519DF|nr:acetyl-CoA carboxylase carboxyltransferase subunit alpha [Clostridium sp. 'White wine YQ']MDD7793285.1 acetyl-CoA carboxylase carboxyltransferase subunit alpha [Clostridium sp. 'White wine YQ']